jgi:hypothetical protein
LQKGSFKKLIKNHVIGHYVSIKELNNGHFFIDVLYSGEDGRTLLIYDPGFNPIKDFKNVQHYEMIHEF